MNFSNLNDMSNETRGNLGYYDDTETVEEKHINDLLEKKKLIKQLFKFHHKFDDKVASLIAGNKYTTLELIEKIHEIHEKYKGTDKEVFFSLDIIDEIMYVKTVKALEYIDENIYALINFKKSKSIPSGDTMFLISVELYKIIMLERKTREKVSPGDVIGAIGEYNTLVKTDAEGANTFLRDFADNPVSSVGSAHTTKKLTASNFGGKGRKMNKRKSIKRKTNKRKTYKRKTYKRK
jgi:hypothetical protein